MIQAAVYCVGTKTLLITIAGPVQLVCNQVSEIRVHFLDTVIHSTTIFVDDNSRSSGTAMTSSV